MEENIEWSLLLLFHTFMFLCAKAKFPTGNYKYKK